jgi:hypothetical protein
MFLYNCRWPSRIGMAIRPVWKDCNCLCPGSETHSYGGCPPVRDGKMSFLIHSSKKTGVIAVWLLWHVCNKIEDLSFFVIHLILVCWHSQINSSENWTSVIVQQYCPCLPVVSVFRSTPLYFLHRHKQDFKFRKYLATIQPQIPFDRPTGRLLLWIKKPGSLS